MFRSDEPFNRVAGGVACPRLDQNMSKRMQRVVFALVGSICKGLLSISKMSKSTALWAARITEVAAV